MNDPRTGDEARDSARRRRLSGWSAAARVAVVLCGTLCAALPVRAQSATATTGVVQGTVSDPTGGVVPGVAVILTDLNTSAPRETVTSDAGYYAFSGVLPGRYSVTAALSGFQQAVVRGVAVEVNKTQNVDIKLGVGQVSEIVEVNAGAAVALQQNDSTVVNTMSERTVLRLPNLSRSLEAIQFNQPLAVPYMGGDSNRTRAGAIAGARTDQNTYTLDGADVSDNVVGDNFLEALPAAVVPLPAESVEEFSAATTNANATFGRGSGGQFVIVTKRGTNAFRGSTYLYHQNDGLNANSWNRERLGLDKAPLKNNRSGFSVGGPIFRSRTFFFTNYEAQRFPRTTEVARIVPTDALRSGLLRFRDAAGNTVGYDLRALDPRGIGLNPVVSALWGTLPGGNDPSRGDGLNTIGFTADADTSFNSDTVVLRLDHNFRGGWRTDANYRFGSTRETGAAQADIGGLLPGSVKGQPVGTEDLPREPRFGAFGVTGQITPSLMNETRASYVRGFLAFTRVNPFAQVPAASIALDIGGVDEPLDVSQANARSQVANAHTYQFINNSTWTRNHHTVLFGGTFRREYWYFQRNEQLAGSLTTPVAQITAGTNVNIPAGLRPPTCGAGVTSSCLLAADVNRFSQLFAGSLGLVDSVSVLGMRDASLGPLPLGTPQEINTITDGIELYASDTWRVRQHFTLNLGLSYQVRLSPKETQDRYAFLIDADTQEVLDSDVYLSRARTAAEAGRGYNPRLAFLPLTSSDRDQYYDTDWSNLGPRLAATWSPQFEGGILGRLLSRDRTVLRGGYSLVFDRTNSVQQILALGTGYGENLSVLAPRCNAQGTPGANCTPGGADPLSVFRVGVDGPVPLPANTAVTAPIVPSALNVTTLADTNIKTGRTHSFNLSYQRELPGNVVFETGGVLRLGRQLPQAWVLSSVPYFHEDQPSGQTLAQAYDAIAEQLRGGVPASTVTPQPWFENQVGVGQSALLAAQQATSFIDGNLSALWLQVNNRRVALGQEPLSNRQIQTLWSRGDGGESLYQAFYTSVRRRSTNGLSMSGSYTLSRALDQGGRRQNNIGAQSSGFEPDIDWGPADFDRRHVLNLTGVYDLPFGASGGLLSRITGGWYVAGIFAASSGVPLDLCQRTGVFGGGLAFTGCVGAIPTRDDVRTTVSENNAGSGGIGTTGNPATGGTGLNLFDDPEAVFNSFRRVRISQDDRAGRATLHGLPRWNLDLSIGKRTRLANRVHGVFTAEIVNVFNSLQYSNPALNLASPASFGVITSQANAPRQVQLGFRVEF
ncbi:MAG: carboxypeptidase regulatory-like domain-containing protein [Acidobacteria bacterium]|nr:carboxypeptidase regulatory-like domain-containing protein [Acidobacteriota bacterium]